MKITLKELRLIGACEQQVELFKETFGTEVELTVENALRYGALFDIDWIASKVLQGGKLADYRAKCAPLDADYWAKCAPLWDDYRAKCAPLWADYEAKRATLDAGYEAKRATLWADYEAKRAPLAADYRAKCALLFAEVLSV